MINKYVIDTIEELKHHTSTFIDNIQKAKVPTLYKLEIERRYSYESHGEYNSIYQEDAILFLCHNLPFNVSIADITNHQFRYTMQEIVDLGLLRPFMLFIDNKFIKWSDIEIVNDCKYSYILISNHASYVKNPDLKMVLLHYDISYSENVTTIPDNCYFAFDSSDCLVTSQDQGDVYTCICDGNIKSNIHYEVIKLKEGINTFEKCNDESYKITDTNVLIFHDGYLDTELSNVTYYNINTINIDYVTDESYAYLFYYTKGNKSYDNIFTILNKKELQSELEKEAIGEYITEYLQQGFDFRFSFDNDYESNILFALEYIMNYNPILMSDVLKKASNVYSRIYTGYRINQRTDGTGYFTMSRTARDELCCPVIVFKNGELYEGYHLIKYHNNTFTLPNLNIKDDDVFEFLYLNNIENRVYPMYFGSNEDNVYTFDSSIDFSTMNLYTMTPRNPEFDIEVSDDLVYEIPYKYELREDGKYKMYPEDPFFYDKTLYMASSRQFRYQSTILKDDQITVVLSSDFSYCNYKGNYMVFINGRRLDQERYSITINQTTRPFDEKVVYLDRNVSVGDRVEIIYMPGRCTSEVLYQEKLDESGIVQVSNENLTYALQEEIYFLFVNGKKLLSSEFKAISSNRIKITKDLDTISNVTIMRHVDNNELLSAYFIPGYSTLDMALDSAGSDIVNKLYDTGHTYKDIETSQYEESFIFNDIIKKIISNFYLRPYINNGSSIKYDFEDFISEGQDAEGNEILDIADNNKETRIDRG